MATWRGINPPFLGGAQNVLSFQEDDRLIKNDLKQLYLTLPGERYRRPDFGTLLRAFPFEFAEDAGLSQLKQSLKSATDRFEDRVTFTDAIFKVKPDDHLVEVTVIVTSNADKLTKYFIEIKLETGGRRG
jgi:phage baseplate assembly protein W